MDKWYGEERRCVTDWQELQPGEERFIAQTTSSYWEWGSHIAGECVALGVVGTTG